MKKKIKDYTIKELYEYCIKKEECIACPFSYNIYPYLCKINEPSMIEEQMLEKEVEIPDKVFGNSEKLEAE